MKYCAFVLLFLAGCAEAPTSIDVAQPAAEPVNVEPLPSPTAPKPSAKPTSYAEALALSHAEGKPLFLFFGARWCSSCQLMKRTTLEDPLVQKELQKMVVWFVDADGDPRVMREYHIAALPTYVLSDPNKSYLLRHTGPLDPTRFLHWLKEE